MARQNINVIERHLEKGVFAVTAFVLVWALVQYLLSSPNSVTIGAQTVGPSRVDQLVRTKADEVLARVAAAEPEDVAIQDTVVKMPPPRNPTELTRAVAWRKPILEVGEFRRGPGARSVELAEVVAPDPPVVLAGRNLVQKNVGGYPPLESTARGINPSFRRTAIPGGGLASMTPRTPPRINRPPTPSASGSSAERRAERHARRGSSGGSSARSAREARHAARRGGARSAAPRPSVVRRPIVRRPNQIGPGGIMDPQSNPLNREDVNWATIFFTFNVEKQRELLKQAGYSLHRQEVTFSWPRIQRRSLKADGRWSDWEEVRTFEPYVPVTIPTIETGPDGQPTPTAVMNVQMFGQIIRSFQPEVMRPGFLELVSGTRWEIPRLPGVGPELFEAEGDNRFVHILARWDPDYTPPDDGLGDGRPWWIILAERREKDREEQQRQAILDRRLQDAKTPEERAVIIANSDLKEAEKLFKKGTQADLVTARSLAEKTVSDPVVPAGLQNRADELLREIYKKQAEELNKQMREQAQQAQRSQRLAQLGVDPSILLSRPSTTLLWAHDLTVEPGMVYQYRAQAQLYNVFAGQPDRLKDPNDARKVILEGQWSEPSEPVQVERDFHFFLTSASEERKLARLHTYKWFMGQWVRDDCTAEIGEKIGEVARVKVGSHEDQRAVPREVDFTSDYTVVDIDFDRRLPDVNGSRAGNGLARSGRRSGATVALVYLDEKEELHERLWHEDRNSTLRQSLEDQVFKLPPPLQELDRRINQRTQRPVNRATSASQRRAERHARRGRSARHGN